MAFRSPRKNFDKSLIEDALRMTPAKRFRESCELYEFYTKVTPYSIKPFVKSFSSFAEYEKWKKDNPEFLTQEIDIKKMECVKNGFKYKSAKK